MRIQHALSPTSALPSKARAEDLVYFRFGKGGEGNLQKVRSLAESKGCTMASVIRELITRGLADLETEQAIIAAHKGGGASATVNAGS